jgi:Ca2+-binding RTX toxin-like protein
VTAGTGLAGLARITIDSGSGNDTIDDSDGPDVIGGGDGNDVITGNRGDDFVVLGAGDDTVIWNSGDGNYLVEGEAGSDTLSLNGSAVDEKFEVSPNGQRTRLTREVGSVATISGGAGEVSVQGPTVKANLTAAQGGTDHLLFLKLLDGPDGGSGEDVLIGGPSDDVGVHGEVVSDVEFEQS